MSIGIQQRRRALHLSWAFRILLGGCSMAKREFAEMVDTVEEGGNVVSKVGGR